MVKLQKQFAYRYKDREHYKHVVTVPDEAVEKLGWGAGKELEWTLSKNSLVLQPIDTNKAPKSEERDEK